MNVLKKSILLKFLFGIILPVMICLCILLVSIFVLVKDNVESSTAETLTANSKQASYQVEGFFTEYMMITETLATNPEVQALFSEANKEVSISAVTTFPVVKTNLVESQELDPETILSVWIADVDASQLFQHDGWESGPDWDITTRPWYVTMEAEDATILSAPYIDSVTGKLVVTAATPVYDSRTGVLLGAVGLDIALDQLNQIMASYTLGDTGFFLFLAGDGSVIYDKNQDNIMKNVSEIGLSAPLLKAFEDKKEDYFAYEKDGMPAYGYYSLIGDTGWSVLSSLPEAEFYESYNSLMKVSIGIFLGALIILGAVITMISRGIVKPLKKLAVNAHEIAAGNLSVEVDTRAVDETGQVAEGLANTVIRLQEYIKYIDEISAVLDEIASGNLVFELKHNYVGEFAKIKTALENIQGTFSHTFSEIASAAGQVASGSEQLAQGAQLLSQGSMEQASSVEELSATILEVSEGIKGSARNADQARDITVASEEEVEHGNQQMREMIGAMEEIKDASRQISNIIKAIDDIAFQTNILALNAAVEAARAGEAGKGFAVVADEVRNLAGKSGEAAKDTTDLIETAIRAVENGNRIVAETAVSLEKIVANTKQSGKMVGDISTANNQQANAMHQVTEGVEQISTVVQTNSATAEETAAASEELSSQANLLKELISQFKLQ
ncbi:HAMP domain-containing protein [Aminipila butyrica]|uniref:HAMP domain-containing protein n=1 Tax=Aminipila butyrica TaxID=433296 RepID=A0A858BR67_9FIRM|nr:methyl-accepting chemotaxis protein [Aminipila butyrica]QIB68353.1 HAMP domain-containing protein [Aminipila butyrica]